MKIEVHGRTKAFASAGSRLVRRCQSSHLVACADCQSWAWMEIVLANDGCSFLGLDLGSAIPLICTVFRKTGEGPRRYDQRAQGGALSNTVTSGSGGSRVFA